MSTAISTLPTVVTVDPRTDPRWHTLTATAGSVFTSAPWIRSVCDTYGFVPQARVIPDHEGRPIGGFAWVPISDVCGDRLVSLPFSDRADPLVTDDAMWLLLVDDALGSAVPLKIRCLNDAVSTADPRLTLAGEAAWHGTPLGAPIPDLYRSICSAARRNIATAERNGVRVQAMTSLEAVRVYHRLHVSLRKNKYRLLAQPVGLFERIWHEFSACDGIVTLLAFVDDEPIAGAIYLVWNEVLYYKFGASLAGTLPLRPNDALAWAALRWASERELRLLDWGLSDLDQPGLVAYKRKWASKEKRIVTLRSNTSPGDGHSEIGWLLGELTDLLTDEAVSDRVTERAGALLYRYFA